MKRYSGFTLVELMTVVGVIAIITAIALPAYNAQVLKSRRAEAINGIGELQLRQERWRAEHSEFATTAQLGVIPSSPYYSFAVGSPVGTCADGSTACTPTNCYVVSAETIGSQTADDGTCGTLTLANRCGHVEKASTPSPDCWSR